MLSRYMLKIPWSSQFLVFLLLAPFLEQSKDCSSPALNPASLPFNWYPLDFLNFSSLLPSKAPSPSEMRLICFLLLMTCVFLSRPHKATASLTSAAHTACRINAWCRVTDTSDMWQVNAKRFIQPPSSSAIKGVKPADRAAVRGEDRWGLQWFLGFNITKTVPKFSCLCIISKYRSELIIILSR